MTSLPPSAPRRAEWRGRSVPPPPGLAPRPVASVAPMSADATTFDPRAFLEAFFAELGRVKKLERPAIAEALRDWEIEDLRWETPWSDIRTGWNSIEEHADILGAVGDKLSH